jgi:hypothetical protein
MLRPVVVTAAAVWATCTKRHAVVTKEATRKGGLFAFAGPPKTSTSRSINLCSSYDRTVVKDSQRQVDTIYCSENVAIGMQSLDLPN